MKSELIKIEELKIGVNVYHDGLYREISALVHSVVMNSESVTVYTLTDLPFTSQYGDLVRVLVQS